MKAKDVMTRPVISVEPDTSVQQAAQLMLQRRISGLPVIDKSGRLVGIVSEADFLRRAETGTQRRRARWLEFLMGPGQLADDYVHTHGRKVEEVMTPDPQTVAEDAQLDEVVQVMEKRRIKRLPVMRGNQVVGIVSRANLLHALASAGQDVKPPTTSDDTIRERLLCELSKQRWAPLALPGSSRYTPPTSGRCRRCGEHCRRQDGARSPCLDRSYVGYGLQSTK